MDRKRLISIPVNEFHRGTLSLDKLVYPISDKLSDLRLSYLMILAGK
jgi:hypothetical protein